VAAALFGISPEAGNQ